jgi:Flp pilus assembly protein TadD
VEARRVGAADGVSKNYAEAAVFFKRLSETFPNAPKMWTSLAINCVLLRNREQAELAHRRALESDTTNDFSRQASNSFTSRYAGERMACKLESKKDLVSV